MTHELYKRTVIDWLVVVVKCSLSISSAGFGMFVMWYKILHSFVIKAKWMDFKIVKMCSDYVRNHFL